MNRHIERKPSGFNDNIIQCCYIHALMNFCTVLIYIHTFFSILVYSNYSLIVYHIVLIFHRGVCKSGKEIWHPCRLIYVEQDVEAMFHFCPWHAHLHKSKMAAVGHLEFLTFVKLTHRASCNTSFLTNLSTPNSFQCLFLRFNVI